MCKSYLKVVMWQEKTTLCAFMVFMKKKFTSTLQIYNVVLFIVLIYQYLKKWILYLFWIMLSDTFVSKREKEIINSKKKIKCTVNNLAGSFWYDCYIRNEMEKLFKYLRDIVLKIYYSFIVTIF